MKRKCGTVTGYAVKNISDMFSRIKKKGMDQHGLLDYGLMDRDIHGRLVGFGMASCIQTDHTMLEQTMVDCGLIEHAMVDRDVMEHGLVERSLIEHGLVDCGRMADSHPDKLHNIFSEILCHCSSLENMGIQSLFIATNPCQQPGYNAVQTSASLLGREFLQRHNLADLFMNFCSVCPSAMPYGREPYRDWRVSEKQFYDMPSQIVSSHSEGYGVNRTVTQVVETKSVGTMTEEEMSTPDPLDIEEPECVAFADETCKEVCSPAIDIKKEDVDNRNDGDVAPLSDTKISQISDDDAKKTCKLWLQRHTCHVCGQSVGHHFLVNNALLSTETDRPPYECHRCSKKFLLLKRLKDHLARYHAAEKPYVCCQCDKRFSAQDAFVRHLSLHDAKNPFECLQCGKLFRTKTWMLKHGLLHQNSWTFDATDLCAKEIKVKTEVEKDYVCCECAKSFSTPERLVTHLLKHGILKRNYRCRDCGKMSFSSSAAIYHTRTAHEARRELECGRCHERFITEYMLKKHLRKAHNVRDFSLMGGLNRSAKLCCELCGKMFRHNCWLKRHLRTHSGEKPFKCTLCDRQYKEEQHLKSHMKTCHSGIKQYTCSECGKQFSHKHTLAGHMRTHTGEKPYMCTECPSQFRSLAQLIRHKRTHTGERPYPCIMCNKRFASIGSQRRHMMVHTGEKRFSCELCSKRFAESSELRIHVRRHTGERPFKCFDCNRTFTRGNDLNVHLKSRKNCSLSTPSKTKHCSLNIAPPYCKEADNLVTFESIQLPPETT